LDARIVDVGWIVSMRIIASGAVFGWMQTLEERYKKKEEKVNNEL
jgi:hypothetical protein